jgi:peptide/nickel transport system substrate-binding protein
MIARRPLVAAALAAPAAALAQNTRVLRFNGWIGWPDSPELERLRDSWFDAPDLAAQQAITRRIQAQAMVDVPMVPVGQYFLTTAHRRNVSGILGGVPSFWNVWKS